MKKINASGFLMMEVLISLFIIAIVFLSLLAYQIVLLKNTESLNFKTIATQQLLSFSEMLLVSKVNSERQTFFSNWNIDNAIWLPQGEGAWSYDQNHHCMIQLQWFFKQKQSQLINVYC